MADVKWIKITTDIFDDDKILLIESLPEKDSLIVIWFKLLCMAGKQNNSGVFTLNDRIAYTDEMLATIFRRPINTVRLALQTFEGFGMIDIIDGVITIPNWEKHQSIEKLDKLKEQTRQRVAKHRKKQELLAKNNDVTQCNADCNVTVTHDVTQCNATDKIRVDKKRKDKSRKEVDVVNGGETPPDYTDPDNKLEYFKGKVMLSENQIADLLDKMGLEAFDEYVDRLNNWISNPDVQYVKSHYDTILKWYNADRQT